MRITPRSAILVVGISFIIVGVLFAGVGTFTAFHLTDYENATGGPDWVLPVAFIGMGTVFAGMGSFFAYVCYRTKRKERQLIENGRYVMATVDDLINDYSVRVNGVPGKAVVCSYYDPYTGETSRFQSDPLFRITRSRESLIGELVRVYVNKSEAPNYNNYFVDTKTLFTRGDLHDYD